MLFNLILDRLIGSMYFQGHTCGAGMSAVPDMSGFIFRFAVFLVAKQLYEALMSFFMSFFLYVCLHFLKNASFTQDNQGGLKGSQEESR